MSRHENADVIRRGYEDQKAGTVDPVLAEEDSTHAVLYRTGMRERKREEFDEIHGEEAQRMRALYPDETEADEDVPEPAVPAGYRPMSEAPKNGCPIAALYADGTEHKAAWDDMAAGMPHKLDEPRVFNWVEVFYGSDRLRSGCQYRGQPIAWRDYPFESARVVQTVDGFVAPDGVRPITNGPGGAFSEPVPGAKKPRKAKPADDGQASLF